MRALVTGASGFLGRHLIKALINRGDFVVSLIRDRISGTTRPRCNSHVRIFGSFEQVERAISEYEIDVVFHLAAQAQVSVAFKDPIHTFETNIAGTWRVLEACRRQGVRVIIASSDKAYGDTATPYREDQALQPFGVYATSKACADMIAQAYKDDLNKPVSIVRCGNIYGPGQTNLSTLITGTIYSILNGQRPLLRSNGRTIRDYLFVDDAVAGYLLIADKKANDIFNLGTYKGHTALEVVQKILLLMDSPMTIDIKEITTMVPLEIENQIVDNHKAKKYLGWEPKYPLKEGLKKTIEWYKYKYHKKD